MGDYYSVVRSNSNNELTHWKYSKKYKKNGKWVYVDDVGTTGEDSDQSPYREYTRLQDKLGFDERDAAKNASKRYENKRERAMDYNHSQSTNSHYSQSLSDQFFKDEERSGRAASEAVKRYYKTPIGRLDRMGDAIDRGRSKISKALTRAAKRIEPKKRSSW